MARPDPDRHERRHSPRDKGAQQDGQEEEQKREEKKETELERAQNRLGNAAMSAMLGASNAAGDGAGGGGAGLAMSTRTEEKEGIQYGGEADPVDDPGITMEELARSWNPRLKKDKERPEFTEAMPDDELPPEDEAFLDRVRQTAPPPLPAGQPLDGILQPSAAAVRIGLGRWAREAGRWLEPGPANRAFLRALSPPVPCLQDPHGRVVLARSRVAAALACLLLSRPWPADRLEDALLMRFCLEVGSSGAFDDVRRWAEVNGGDLPQAHACLAARLLGEEPREIEPRDLEPGAMSRIFQVLAASADLAPASALLPSMPDEAPHLPVDGDDPLGLDALLASFTGAVEAPEASLYQTCLLAAEKIAAGTSNARVRLAGAAAAVADGAAALRVPVPAGSLLEVMARCDADATQNLGMLVEIARAAQKRSVPVRGVRNGLKRAAKGLDDMTRSALVHLARIAAAVVPGQPEAPAYVPREPDLLDVALRDGEPLAALSAVRALPASAEREVTSTLLHALAGKPPPTLLPELGRALDAVSEEGRGALALSVEVVAGAVLLWAGNPDSAVRIAQRHLEIGIERRNGVVVAGAVLLAMESLHVQGRPDDVDRLRVTGGAILAAMGADGALSLLARWRPPSLEEDLSE